MSSRAALPSDPAARPLRVVSIGGGTGQPNLICALRALPCAIEAIVAMADDGRSTGILRERSGVLPPGDVRKCLSALASDPGAPLARAFAHRFGYLDNHALGNLVLAALCEEGATFTEAVCACEQLLDCVGRVHPSTTDDVHLIGRTVDGRVVRGQAALSHGSCALETVWLDSKARAHAPAVAAIMAADLVVLGPGSLFTSIIPNLLVDGIATALRATPAMKAFICPKVDMQGETWGMDGDECLAALERHGMAGAIDIAVFHRSADAAGSATRTFRALVGRLAEPIASPSDAANLDGGPSRTSVPARHDAFPFRDVALTGDAERRVRARVPWVAVRDFSCARSRSIHDPSALGACILEVMNRCRSRRR
ncbi:protein of unknown function UPF0052 and CofD [Coriobacterium glomerans PW2]|uniref:Putative gluconeogenesis factor n=1 Tax=Coriobacterium glomerans (strain ATCC 49209 / DSM 20642 / JCM 10262 / PW2) TaxID=700015 RepID=F2N8H5_CORGP|nr:gluconeogenesis factor YvcK family protein [Coriobacterium glomerans]AEB07358.1 protein of unknown function UPF0052 and CofD [Coriobacterium glomerans PW2]